MLVHNSDAQKKRVFSCLVRFDPYLWSFGCWIKLCVLTSVSLYGYISVARSKCGLCHGRVFRVSSVLEVRYNRIVAIVDLLSSNL